MYPDMTELIPKKQRKKSPIDERPMFKLCRKKPYRAKLERKNFSRAVMEALVMLVKVYGTTIDHIEKFILKHYQQSSYHLHSRIHNVLKTAQKFGFITENNGRYKFSFLERNRALKPYYITLPKINRKRKDSDTESCIQKKRKYKILTEYN